MPRRKTRGIGRKARYQRQLATAGQTPAPSTTAETHSQYESAVLPAKGDKKHHSSVYESKSTIRML